MKQLKSLNFFWTMVCLTIFSGCQNEENSSVSRSKQAIPAVTVTPVKQEKVVKMSETAGRTIAQKKVNLVARVQGYLEKRFFKEGEEVKKGDLLFVIEQAPYQIEVNAARANLSEAEAILQNAESYLKRLKKVRSGAVSQSDLDRAKSDVLKAQAQLKNIREKLKQALVTLGYTKIYSPIDGRIGLVSIHVGNLVSPETGTLATIVQMDPINVIFTMTETEMLTETQHQIKQGKATPFVPKIQLANGTIYPYEGITNFVSPIVDIKTGTVTIRAAFPNPSTAIQPERSEITYKRRELIPGQFVKVLLRKGDVASEYTVPQSAIQEDQGGKYVLVVDAESRVRRRPVVVGDRIGVNWVIKQGLQLGELVVSEGSQKVSPGIVVQTSTFTPATQIEN